MKPIVHVPDNILTTPAKIITVFDTKLKRTIADMTETLRATVHPKGVGLAAPQVGLELRLFITKPTPQAAVRVFINPEIIKRSKTQTTGVPERENKLEGCLSIPEIWGRVKRAASLTLRYQDETGKSHEENFTGFLATIIQHETDHVNGILFTQRVLEQKGKLYEVEKDKDGKDVLEEITLQ